MSSHPNYDGARMVRSPDVEVGPLRDVVEKESQEIFRLLVFEADDVLREPLIDVKCFLSSDWVDTDKRMLEK